MRATTSTLRAIADMACANPFGEERERLERQVGEAKRGASRSDVFARSLARASSAVTNWKRSERHSSPDHDAYERAAFYVVFHRFSAEIDAHIQKQRASEAIVRPDFVPGLLSAFESFGLSDARAHERVALAFQLRRAFVAIDRSVTGASAPTQHLREALWNNIFTHDLGLYAGTLMGRMEDFSTILLGPTGTGKGAAASAIGMAGYIPWNAKSGRFDENFAKTFLPLNLSEYSANLIESELFGHEKGAFTGAIQRRAGAFERCSAMGSVFLDEIGDLDPTVQVKLLRVLEARQFTPVGGAEPRRFSGRIIAATHRSLESLRTAGRMRHDFYYRLCSDVIHLPTLRERLDADPTELTLLVSQLATRILGVPSHALAASIEATIAEKLPRDYAWPGNIRELEQCIRRILLTQRYTGDPLALGWQEEQKKSDGPAALVVRAQMLYRESRNYGAVARALGIDRRTAKKYVDSPCPE